MKIYNGTVTQNQKERHAARQEFQRVREQMNLYNAKTTQAQKEKEGAKKGILKRTWWPVGVILCFLILSFLIIPSDYNHAHGDGGIYARCARVLYETNRIDITYSASSLIGQLFFSNVLCHVFGFQLRVLNISVYLANFLLLTGMYLLLLEMGIKPFPALFGSLALLISPISLRMIDWYMTEPFFMFYSVFSILFLVKGLRRERYAFLYTGGIFAALAILTRQHAVSIPVALMAVCLLYKKELKKGDMFHCIISAAIPLLAIALFYVLLSKFKVIQTDVPHDQTISKYLTIFKGTKGPVKILLQIYYDILFFLHYIPLYLAPLFIALFVTLIARPKRIMELCTNCTFLVISILFVSIGTISMFLKNNRLMPYLPSIFRAGALTKVFTVNLLKSDQAASLLTIFTATGAILFLTKLSEHAISSRGNKAATTDCLKASKATTSSSPGHAIPSKVNKPPVSNVKSSHGNNIGHKKEIAIKRDAGATFFCFWGVFILLTTIAIGLHYDRYVYPISILMIYLFLHHFSFLNESRAVLITVFVLIYSAFIFQIAGSRLSIDLQWRESYALVQESIPPHKINGGLGFNQYESFNEITDLYKNVTIKRPVNWYNFHPLADFFVTGDMGLEKKDMGLILYRSSTQKGLFGSLEAKCFVYKRKDNHKGLIWF
ncbi:hypothetical protein JXL19_09535 [bacterium]|nr:hypothetical protein [bacterium]